LKGETASGVGTSIEDVEGWDGEDKGPFGSGEIGNVGVERDSLKDKLTEE
jgi:hypothetical protein